MKFFVFILLSALTNSDLISKCFSNDKIIEKQVVSRKLGGEEVVVTEEEVGKNTEPKEIL